MKTNNNKVVLKTSITTSLAVKNDVTLLGLKSLYLEGLTKSQKAPKSQQKIQKVKDGTQKTVARCGWEGD